METFPNFSKTGAYHIFRHPKATPFPQTTHLHTTKLLPHFSDGNQDLREIFPPYSKYNNMNLTGYNEEDQTDDTSENSTEVSKMEDISENASLLNFGIG